MPLAPLRGRLRALTRAAGWGNLIRPLLGGAFSGAVFRGAAGTALSRVVGLGREVALAHVFGASAALDAFFIAYFVPNLLRRLLGEGGMAAAFLPLYVQAGDEGAPFARATLRILIVVLVPICALGAVLAPVYIPALAAGFPRGKLTLAVSLARWTFPFLAMASFSALAGAILNAHGRFFLPAVAPSAWSLGLIAGALLVSRLVSPPVLGLAVGLLLGGAGMVAVQAPAAWPHLRGAGRASPGDLVALGRRLLPVLGGLAVAEMNLLVDNRLASYLADGSVATLQYAMRLFQLPLGILAVSVATAALPRLSAYAAAGREQGFRQALGKGVALGAALLLPATFGLLVLRKPVVQLLFQHGAFTAADTARTAAALAAYLAGLWGYGLVYLFSRAFYALGRPGIPVLTAAVAVGVNVGLDLAWVGPWGTFGLALATGMAGWVDALLQGAALWRWGGGWIPWRAVGAAGLAALGMGALLWGLDRLALAGLAPWGRVLLGVPAGLLLYLSLGRLVGLQRALKGAG
ncbi:TPA: murein biosynthesis integral membrane protein MurJ [Candidatus Bipolaricaulota bacterium]|nr:murein biosynthesis integral membrane protein MurJ [Candidatus Bipolaricaulota bacterium]